MEITKDVLYVGVNDYEIDLFEGQYAVPNGMAYNSYVILDNKIAVFDTVDGAFGEEWLEKLEKAFGGKTPDYLIVQHMEPDHSANIAAFAEKYPTAQIVGSAKAFAMMKNFYGDDYESRRMVIAEGDTLSLGKHQLVFVAAPMVHWPEVMVTYDKTDKVLFSADGFGKFGAIDTDEDWACEARRYYFGIVGKYGVQVQTLLKKLAAYPVDMICPLHGPVLKENLAYYFGLYDTWSSYGVESEGVFIAYTSVYGNTKKAVELLAKNLQALGQKTVVCDLARSDMSEAVEDAFRYGKIVLATTTYNGEIFPFMREFISQLVEHNFRNKKMALIENGSWAPMAARVMHTMLEKCKDITYAETQVKILSAMTKENEKEVAALAEELCK
ncbi:MAG: FprA family A-type flavoprotein [Clostridia bacterium]|nr:FprA family A-type flavoprotein [Clostridia bacterium]